MSGYGQFINTFSTATEKSIANGYVTYFYDTYQFYYISLLQSLSSTDIRSKLVSQANTDTQVGALASNINSVANGITGATEDEKWSNFKAAFSSELQPMIQIIIDKETVYTTPATAFDTFKIRTTNDQATAILAMNADPSDFWTAYANYMSGKANAVIDGWSDFEMSLAAGDWKDAVMLFDTSYQGSGTIDFTAEFLSTGVASIADTFAGVTNKYLKGFLSKIIKDTFNSVNVGYLTDGDKESNFYSAFRAEFLDGMKAIIQSFKNAGNITDFIDLASATDLTWISATLTQQATSSQPQITTFSLVKEIISYGTSIASGDLFVLNLNNNGDIIYTTTSSDMVTVVADLITAINNASNGDWGNVTASAGTGYDIVITYNSNNVPFTLNSRSVAYYLDALYGTTPIHPIFTDLAQAYVNDANPTLGKSIQQYTLTGQLLKLDFQANDIPLAGLKVEIYDPSTSTLLGAALSDANGNFTYSYSLPNASVTTQDFRFEVYNTDGTPLNIVPQIQTNLFTNADNGTFEIGTSPNYPEWGLTLGTNIAITDDDRLGAELQVNGDFSQSSGGWYVSWPEISLLSTGSGSYTFYCGDIFAHIFTGKVLTIGKTYRISFDITAITLSGLEIGLAHASSSFGGDPPQGTFYTSESSVATYTVTFIAESEGIMFYGANVTGFGNITITNVSIKELISSIAPYEGNLSPEFYLNADTPSTDLVFSGNTAITVAQNSDYILSAYIYFNYPVVNSNGLTDSGIYLRPASFTFNDLTASEVLNGTNLLLYGASSLYKGMATSGTGTWVKMSSRFNSGINTSIQVEMALKGAYGNFNAAFGFYIDKIELFEAPSGYIDLTMPVTSTDVTGILVDGLLDAVTHIGIAQPADATHPQIVNIVPANVSIGDKYILDLNSLSMVEYTAAAATIADVTSGLTSAIVAKTADLTIAVETPAASGVAQVSSITPADVKVGAQFTVMLNNDGKATFTATDTNIATVTAGLTDAINADTADLTISDTATASTSASQVTTITPQDVRIGAVFTIDLNGNGSVQYTAAATTVADVVTGLVSAIAAASTGDWKTITATQDGTKVTIAANKINTPFTVSQVGGKFKTVYATDDSANNRLLITADTQNLSFTLVQVGGEWAKVTPTNNSTYLTITGDLNNDPFTINEKVIKVVDVSASIDTVASTANIVIPVTTATSMMAKGVYTLDDINKLGGLQNNLDGYISIKTIQDATASLPQITDIYPQSVETGDVFTLNITVPPGSTQTTDTTQATYIATDSTLSNVITGLISAIAAAGGKWTSITTSNGTDHLRLTGTTNNVSFTIMQIKVGESTEVFAIDSHASYHAVTQSLPISSSDRLAISQTLINNGFANPLVVASASRDEVLAVLANIIDSATAIALHGLFGRFFHPVINYLSSFRSKNASSHTTVLGGKRDLKAQLTSVLGVRCHCDDCQSGVSPLAYLTDLINYITGKRLLTSITFFGIPVPVPVNLTILENKFHQDFVELPASCDDVKNQICQVIIAIEVLRRYVNVSAPDIDVQSSFQSSEREYLLNAYQLLLSLSGTNYDEIRTVRTDEDKRSLADRLGINYDNNKTFLDKLFINPQLVSPSSWGDYKKYNNGGIQTLLDDLSNDLLNTASTDFTLFSSASFSVSDLRTKLIQISSSGSFITLLSNNISDQIAFTDSIVNQMSYTSYQINNAKWSYFIDQMTNLFSINYYKAFYGLTLILKSDKNVSSFSDLVSWSVNDWISYLNKTSSNTSGSAKDFWYWFATALKSKIGYSYLTERNLEELFGFIDTTKDVFSDGAKLGDTYNFIDRWNLRGIKWGKNTDSEGYIYLKMLATDPFTGATINTVVLYKDSARTQIVGVANFDSTTDKYTITESQDSGLSGEIIINFFEVNNASIYISAVPLLTSWRLQAMRDSWLALDNLNEQPIIDPDLIGPGDIVYPYNINTTTPTQAIDFWQKRKDELSAYLTAIQTEKTNSETTPPAYTGGSLTGPAGIASKNENLIYISDTGNNKIKKLNPKTLTFTDFVTQVSSNFKGLQVTKKNKLIVADALNNAIKQFDEVTANNDWVFGSAGSDLGKFTSPSDVALNEATGDIYITDSTSIQRHTLPTDYSSYTQLSDLDIEIVTASDTNVAQVTNITPVNVKVGDTFTIKLENTSLHYTATSADVSNVTAGLTALINSQNVGDWSVVTAIDFESYIQVTAKNVNYYFYISRGDAYIADFTIVTKTFADGTHAQITHIVPSNVQKGDVFILILNNTPAIHYVAQEATVADVTMGLLEAINNNGNWNTVVTVSDEKTHLVITGAVAASFTISKASAQVLDLMLSVGTKPASAVAQISYMNVPASVNIGEVFIARKGNTSLTYVAKAATTSDVVQGLTALVGNNAAGDWSTVLATDDSANSRVIITAQTQNVPFELSQGLPLSFTSLKHAAIDKDGNIFYTDAINNRILKLNASGKVQRIIGAAHRFAKDLVLRYTFDEGSGTIARDSSGSKTFRTGTISTTSSSTSVTGSGTQFTKELNIGSVLYDSLGNELGTVASITDNSTLTLANNAISSQTDILFKSRKDPSNMVYGRTGTITTTVSSTSVTGAGTSFTTELVPGAMIYDNAGALLGTVASITNDTQLTLLAGAVSGVTGVAYSATAEAGISGTTTTWSTAATLNVLNFNGTDNVLATTSLAELDKNLQKKRSVEIWFKVTQKDLLNTYQVLYKQGDSTNGMSIYIYNGYLYIAAYGSGFTGAGSFISTKNIVDKAYNHLVFVYDSDASGTQLQGYINGVLFATASGGSGIEPSTSPNGINIGGIAGGGTARVIDPDTLNAVTLNAGNNCFGGSVDTFRIWNRAMDVAEVQGLYSHIGDSDGSFFIPGSVTVDVTGNIYVADTGNARIQKLDGDSNFLLKFGSFGTGDANFKMPSSIAVDKDGNILVTDSSNHNLQSFNAQGILNIRVGRQDTSSNPVSGNGNGEFHLPSGVASDNDGFIYVSDTANNRIQIFSEGGAFVKIRSTYGAGINFNTPKGIAKDSSNNIIIMDAGSNQVIMVGSSTFAAPVIIAGGPWAFTAGSGLCIDKQDYILIATANNTLKKFRYPKRYTGVTLPKGLSLSSLAFSNPSGIALDQFGNVVLADTGNSRILKMTSDGVLIAAIGSSGSGNGQFASPQGVAVDESGNIYVGDTGNNRIQKLDSDGNFIQLWDTNNFTSVSPAITVNGLTALDVDSNRKVYVANTTANNVFQFDAIQGFGAVLEYVTSSSLKIFLDLLNKENSGQQIVDDVASLNLNMSSFRRLTNLLSFADAGNTLTDTQIDDFNSILVQSYKISQYVVWKSEETTNNISLCQDIFQLRSRTDEAAVTLTSWRATAKQRKDWISTLNGRLEEEKNLMDATKDMLDQAEDGVLQDLRDALITATDFKGNTLEDKAQYGTDTLLIDLKNNCCSRTTRVAQAIETLTLLMWAVRNEQLKDVYPDFAIINRDVFDKEWEWMGSYATWRSAQFVFMYPENLLNPSYKSIQSKAFQDFSIDILNDVALTPDSAQGYADKFSKYFNDISNFSIKESKQAWTKINDESSGDSKVYRSLVYFFALSSKNINSIYFSTLDPQGTTDSLISWLQIPGLDQVSKIERIIGSHIKTGSDFKRYLYLFALVKIHDDSDIIDCVALKYDLEAQKWDDNYSKISLPDTVTSSIDSSVKLSYDKESIVLVKRWEKRLESDDEGTIQFMFSSSNVETKNIPMSKTITLTLAQQIALGIKSYTFYWTDTFNYSYLIEISLDSDLSPSAVPRYNFNTSSGLALFKDIKLYSIYRKDKASSEFLFTYSQGVNLKVGYFSGLNSQQGVNGQSIKLIDSSFIDSNTVNSFRWPFGESFIAYMFYSTNSGYKYIEIESDDKGSITCSNSFSFKSVNYIDCQSFYDSNRTDVITLFIDPAGSGTHAFEKGTYVKNTDKTLSLSSGTSIEPLGILNNGSEYKIDPYIIDWDQWKNGSVKFFDDNLYYISNPIFEPVKEFFYYVPLTIALYLQRAGYYQEALDWFRLVYDFAGKSRADKNTYYGLSFDSSSIRVLDDFEYNRHGSIVLNPLNLYNGTLEIVPNPLPNTANPSQSVGQYTRSAYLTDWLLYELPSDLPVDFTKCKINISIKDNSGTPSSVKVFLGHYYLSLGKGFIPIITPEFQAYSTYSATTSVGQWDQLDFALTSTPNQVAANQVTHLLINIAPGDSSKEGLTYWIDNIEVYNEVKVDDNPFAKPDNWLLDPLNPHAIAEQRKDSYIMYTAMSVANCMLDYADSEFTKDTSESLAKARTLYQTAIEILEGEGLQFASDKAAQNINTLQFDLEEDWIPVWNSIKNDLYQVDEEDVLDDLISSLQDVINDTVLTTAQKLTDARNRVNAAIDDPVNFKNIFTSIMNHKALEGNLFSILMADPELIFEFKTKGPKLFQKTVQSYQLLNKNPNDLVIDYVPKMNFDFCVPKNPVIDFMRLKAEMNLYKIRNCRNIAGAVRQVDPFSAPTDASTGLPQIGVAGNIQLPGSSFFRPTIYRYQTLVDRAKQLVTIAQQIEASMLSSLEKLDAERYSLLKAKQDLSLANAGVQLQNLKVKESKDSTTLANLQKDRAQIQVDYYQGLIDQGLSPNETASLAFQTTAIILLDFATIAAIAADAKNLLDPFSSASLYTLQYSAQALQQNAQYFSQLATYERRTQEWQFQKKLGDKDVQIGNQQITIAQDNEQISGQELQIAQMQSDNAQATIDFLTNKFTNAQLYEWMSNTLQGVYKFFLQQATAMAQLASNQLAFERQQLPPGYIKSDYWQAPVDNLVEVTTTADGAKTTDRKGLTGSERLLQDIYQLDNFAFSTDKRKLEMTKIISLASLSPGEFQSFIETGDLIFDTRLDMFDRDFPGHYLRLVKRVKVSVIALIPPTQGIKATLSNFGVTYSVVSGNTFQKIAIARDPESIALTGTSSAMGIFELEQTQTDKLFPFENTGVEGKWRFTMPKASNFFDFSTIADVLITLDYTALANDIYRDQVIQDIGTTYQASRPFSFKNQFADQWYDLNNPELSATPMTVSFNTAKGDFPQNLSDLKIDNIVMYFVKSDDLDPLTDAEIIEDIDKMVVKSLKYTPVGKKQSLGSTAGVTANKGIISTRTIPAASIWGATTGQSVQGTWELTLDNSSTVINLFKNEQITDILFVISYSGDAPQWPK